MVPNAAFPLELNAESSTNTAYTNAIHPYNNINGNDVESTSATATATNAIANANTTHTDTGIDNTHPTINNSNNVNNKTIQPTNENGNVRAPANVVSAGLSLNNNNNVFSREGAMEAFLGKSEARAVVGAAEPYLLLFSNQVM